MTYPENIYVWIVHQDGENRIRKWDTKPFDEATHICAYADGDRCPCCNQLMPDVPAKIHEYGDNDEI